MLNCLFGCFSMIVWTPVVVIGGPVLKSRFFWFFFIVVKLLSWMFQHDCLDTCCCHWRASFEVKGFFLGFFLVKLFSWMFQHDYLDTCCCHWRASFEVKVFFVLFLLNCLVGCFSMIVWTPAVLSVLYACVLYFCICTCSAQLSMFHRERRSRNTLIIILSVRTRPREVGLEPQTSSLSSIECMLVFSYHVDAMSQQHNMSNISATYMMEFFLPQTTGGESGSDRLADQDP